MGVALPSSGNGVGHSVMEAFAANGCNVQALRPDDATWPSTLDLIVMYGPMQTLGPCLLRLDAMSSRRQHVVVWYTEPMPPDWWPTWLTAGVADLRCYIELASHKRLGRRPLSHLAGRLRSLGEMRFLFRRRLLDLIAVFTTRHERFFRNQDLPVAVIPMGYSERFGELLQVPRDIDVAFLGSTRDRRRRQIIGNLQAEFARAGIRFVLKDGSPRYGSVYGAERVRLLNRTKIMLNVMRQPWDDPVFRILLAAPNGTMVLSERVLDPGPFEPGRHFAVAQLSQMVDAVRHHLEMEDERKAIADAAREYVTQELTMKRMAGVLLDRWHVTVGGDP